MSDNFDLKKFLKESKAIENLNPTFKSFNDVKSNETKKSLTENIKTKLNNIPLTEDKLRERIREMILAEMGNDSKEMDGEVYEMDNMDEDDLYEAKKDEEEVAIEDMPAEEDMALDAEPATPEDELSAAASSATGDSKELINHLMTSLDTAKAMGNEKLTTQILNTLKFAIDQSMGGNE
jgi:hypothetical protein